jgi:hypothetical protein
LQANVFFLDEPINVGFSYAEHGQVSLLMPLVSMSRKLTAQNVKTTEEAALDVQAFVQIVSYLSS